MLVSGVITTILIRNFSFNAMLSLCRNLCHFQLYSKEHIFFLRRPFSPFFSSVDIEKANSEGNCQYSFASFLVFVRFLEGERGELFQFLSAGTLGLEMRTRSLLLRLKKVQSCFTLHMHRSSVITQCPT